MMLHGYRQKLKDYPMLLNLKLRSEIAEQSNVKRLYEWLMDENRQPAQTKFTAGELRKVAKEIEFRLSELQSYNREEANILSNGDIIRNGRVIITQIDYLYYRVFFMVRLEGAR